MQPDAVGVRRGQQLGVDAAQQRLDPAVGHQHVAPAVEHERRVGLVAREQVGERRAGRAEVLGAEVGLGVGRGVARREDQRVALPQRHLQVLGQVQQQLAAGPGAAGLDEAEVPGGHPAHRGQVELAAPGRLAPVPEQVAHRRRGPHDRTLAVPPYAGRLPER